MLFLWFIMVLWGFFLTIVNLFPDLPVISQLGTLEGYASDLGEAASGFGAWIPWAAFPVSVGVLLIGVTAVVAIRVIRLIVRTISFGKLDL